MIKQQKKEHKYRVSLYLGKELYTTICGVADFLGIPVATTTRILLETGLQVSKELENKSLKKVKYGKSKI